MKKTLLIVDDDKAFTKVLCDALRNPEYEIVCMNTSQQALDYALEHQPGVMIIDWLMPEMDGLELTKRAREADPFVQVIMISVDPTLETMVQMHDVGVFDYMIKPLNLKKLRTIIKEAFVHSDRWRSSLGTYSKKLKVAKAH